MNVCIYIYIYIIYILLYAQNFNLSVSRDADTLKLEVYGRILNCVSVPVEFKDMS